MAGDINSLNLLVNNNIKSNLYILRLKFMSRMSIFMSSSPLQNSLKCGHALLL